LASAFATSAVCFAFGPFAVISMIGASGEVAAVACRSPDWSVPSRKPALASTGSLVATRPYAWAKFSAEIGSLWVPVETATTYAFAV
jgi:hypothetical protein